MDSSIGKARLLERHYGCFGAVICEEAPCSKQKLTSIEKLIPLTIDMLLANSSLESALAWRAASSVKAIVLTTV
jgi:hypothetical protein